LDLSLVLYSRGLGRFAPRTRPLRAAPPRSSSHVGGFTDYDRGYGCEGRDGLTRMTGADVVETATMESTRKNAGSR